MSNSETRADGTRLPDAQSENRNFRVLLVEDNDLDAKLALRAFDRLDLAIDIARVSDGRECIEYLRREAGFESATRPDVVLLDLNMPVMDGHEVLAERKLDESINAIPIVILSTSSDPRDIAKSYALGGNAYMVKPTGFDEFQTLLKSFHEYWCRTVLLPNTNG